MLRPIRPVRGLHKGGAPAVSRVRKAKITPGPVGRQPANVTRIRNAANHTQRMKMGVDYQIRATSNVVLGHTRTIGPTKAPRVRGSR